MFHFLLTNGLQHCPAEREADRSDGRENNSGIKVNQRLLVDVGLKAANDLEQIRLIRRSHFGPCRFADDRSIEAKPVADPADGSGGGLMTAEDSGPDHGVERIVKSSRAPGSRQHRTHHFQEQCISGARTFVALAKRRNEALAVDGLRMLMHQREGLASERDLYVS